MRHGGRELLSLALMDARNHTLHLLGLFDEAMRAGLVVPQAPGMELPAWLGGHIAWLSEYWIARNSQRGLGLACPATPTVLASIDPTADASFDPALASHDTRWTMPLPGMQSVRAYLLDTMETTLDLLDKTAGDDVALHFFRAALFHEDLRGEQLVSMAQSLGVPLKLQLPGGSAPQLAVLVPAGRWKLGMEDKGFAFDLERGSLAVDVPEFEIDAQPVCWEQYVEFVEDGGYDRRDCWLPEGWDWLQALAQSEGRRGPRHVEQIGRAGGAVVQHHFGKTVRMSGSQPVMHVSWWEADAWARWAGRRLPAEVEWEMAAHAGARRGFRWGDVREWTAGTVRPWPGFVADVWTRYSDIDSQKYFGAARVQRGASFAARARAKHIKTRRYAMPDRDDGFTGFRTCAP